MQYFQYLFVQRRCLQWHNAMHWFSTSKLPKKKKCLSYLFWMCSRNFKGLFSILSKKAIQMQRLDLQSSTYFNLGPCLRKHKLAPPPVWMKIGFYNWVKGWVGTAILLDLQTFLTGGSLKFSTENTTPVAISAWLTLIKFWDFSTFDLMKLLPTVQKLDIRLHWIRRWKILLSCPQFNEVQ